MSRTAKAAWRVCEPGGCRGIDGLGGVKHAAAVCRFEPVEAVGIKVHSASPMELEMAKAAEIRSPVGDWHALRAKPDYKADWRAYGGAPEVVETTRQV